MSAENATLYLELLHSHGKERREILCAKPNPVPVYDRGNLQPWSVKQALAASTQPKGQRHLEPYLNSSVTLCLQKGVKKIFAVQASY